MTGLRQKISELMVAIHRITPELAEYHIADMSEDDLQFRLRMYTRLGLAGVELSVVGPTIRSGDLSSTRFSGPETMTAGSRHSTVLPKGIFARQKSGQTMPDSEVKNRGKLGPGIIPA